VGDSEPLVVDRQTLWFERMSLWFHRQRHSFARMTLWLERLPLWSERQRLWFERMPLFRIQQRLWLEPKRRTRRTKPQSSRPQRRSFEPKRRSFKSQRHSFIFPPLSSTPQPLPRILERLSSNIGRQSAISQPLLLSSSSLSFDKEVTIMTTTIHRSLASLKLPNKVPALITYAQAIVKAMTGNTAFASTTPTMATVTQAINDLQTAETAALARTKGAVTVRNEKRAALVALLEDVRASVQTVANADSETSASVIQNAGLAIRKTPVRAARVFAAKPGAVSGSVALVTDAAARRASYEWQYSSDGGKTWVQAPSTLQAKTTVAGLTPGATVTFRYRAVTKTGEGDWSQPQSIIVK
jgi:hypothetical protein